MVQITRLSSTTLGLSSRESWFTPYYLVGLLSKVYAACEVTDVKPFGGNRFSAAIVNVTNSNCADKIK